MQKVCVIGSVNVDIVYKVKEFVRPGETIEAIDYEEHFGGKGGNQAIACARLGADVSMFGKVGDDEYGERYIKNLKNNNVKSFVVSASGNSTGRAFIEIDQCGENRIVINHGANYAVDIEYIKSFKNEILEHDIFLLQQEIPAETNEYLIKLLREHRKLIVLDPAPVRHINDDVLSGITYLTPNETELDALGEQGDMEANVRKLHDIGVEQVICKSGSKGAYLFCGDKMTLYPADKVDIVRDTTGAGDTFNGAFACALSKGKSTDEAVCFANRAAGLSVQADGAQGGMPWADQIACT